MAEIVDILLVFWIVFAGAVYAIGYFVERQTQEKRKGQLLKAQESKRRFEHAGGAWTDLDSTQRRHSSRQYYATEPTNYYSNSNTNHSASFNTYATEYGPTAADSLRQTGPTYSPGADGHFGRPQDYMGATLASESSHQFDATASIPVATGFNSDCVNWVNEILFLLYTQTNKYSQIIGESITRSLNEKLSSITSTSSEYNKLVIEFEGLNRESSSKPELTNIRTETESDKSISVNCKIYNRFASLDLKIMSSRRRTAQNSYQNDADDADSEPQRYELILENLEGKLRSVAMLGDKLIVIQFIEKPDTKIMLRPKQVGGQISQATRRQLIREDALVQIILQTLTQVVVDLYFGDDVDFPQFKALLQNSPFSTYKNKFNNMLKRQKKHDFFGALSSSSAQQQSNDQQQTRKLFVKILQAKNINYNQNVTCLLELDLPRQQAISSVKSGSNPNWDEHFLFKIQNDKLAPNAELTVELWDSINEKAVREFEQQTGRHSVAQHQQKHWLKSEVTSGAKFLGLARVKIDELRREPSQRASFALHPIGNDLDNSVGGELEMELLFLEHSTSTAAAPTTSVTHSPSADSTNSMLQQQQGDVVSVERKLTPSGYVITTTTIKRQPSLKRQHAGVAMAQQRNHSPNSMDLIGGGLNEADLDRVSQPSEFGLAGQQVQHATDLSAPQSGTLHSYGDGRSEAPSDSTGAPGRLSRSRSRSRSLLRAIKKRFSFSRTRSRSVGEARGRGSSLGGTPTLDYEDEIGVDDDYLRPTASARNLDSPSLESRASSDLSSAQIGGVGGPNSVRAESVPTQRQTSEVPTIVINRGRLSDAGNKFNFTQPKSQLVIEVMEPTLRSDGNGNKENGRLRYYAFSEEEGNKRKWRKRGIKLHLFNEHQFVAAHLAGSSTCHLCGRLFSRRPGKQGYRCRNCHLLSHKQCHVKVDHNCPYATRDGLKLEFIDADPPSSLVDEVNGASSARRQSEQQDLDLRYNVPGTTGHRTDRPNLKMASKSISMDVDDR